VAATKPRAALLARAQQLNEGEEDGASHASVPDNRLGGRSHVTILRSTAWQSEIFSLAADFER
jgi:hypothetical protein